MEASYMILDQANFRVYSKAEVLQLSVKEIVNPQTFDLLQNPVIGGLHDPALGPSRRDDRCESCGQSEKNCPGHLGHIRLPVLLFNPLFFKTLVTLLKGSCLACHRINMKAVQIRLHTYRIQLLHKGFLAEAQDLADRFLDSEKDENTVLQEMKAFVEDTMQNTVRDEKVFSKNVLTQLDNCLRDILRIFSGSKAVCCHCETQNRILKSEYNRTIVGTLVEERGSTKKRKPKTKVNPDQQNGEMEGGVEAEEEVEMESENPGEGNIKADESQDADGDLQTELDHFLKSKHKRCILSPNIARDHLRLLWENDKGFLKQLFPFLATVRNAETPTDVFFLDVIPVPPSKFRPLSVMKERKFEHPQTANLSNVLKECVALKDLLGGYAKRVQEAMGGNVQGLTVPETDDSMSMHMQKIMASWLRLQSAVNVVQDSDLDKLSDDRSTGVKQLLEKKEGLFRMHMMGKRVNFAARSVISPDPYIGTNEIGIPVVFASKLTFPQRVTPWNVQQLRQMVINGPLKYPGASSVINEDGTVVRLSPKDSPKDNSQREALAKQLLVPDKKVSGSKLVCRHLINGDFLLLNRQPTLHRPSIQAHKARVLPDIKTLRMHYSNCKAYNADFDGDEMNAHFPQCEMSRAEASTLACTENQYLVPKDGTPLAGLIQDHMVAGVALTIRGRFFTRKDYCNLIWSAMNDFREKVQILPPAILKPQPLWSGKQIISTILLNIIPKGKAPINLKGKAKIPEKSWTPWTKMAPQLPLNLASYETEALGESTVIFSEGELLQGVLDKAHYGPSTYGLVHCCYELYGGEVAGRLLTYLGRLFTSFLQMVGFSLGVGDILVQRKANKKRRSIIKKSQNVGKNAVMKALALREEETNESETLLELKRAQFEKDGFKMAEIDLCMKGETDRIQDSIAKSIMPGRLEKGFPDNSLQLMVQSGAKGSPVNCMQISCLLGQIELEGRRPPLMLSGRSLPSFVPYDVSPKAGGFVTGRFLTGIRPQEYFFHCMAGREGLIDTAVKTSRSGYLQRCLVKHLEGLMVNYDLTVRDSDGSLVQFYYGEDGIEPIQSPFLTPSQFPFLTGNLHALISSCKEDPWHSTSNAKIIRRTWKKISSWRAHTNELGNWSNRESSFLVFCTSDVALKLSKEEKRSKVTSGACFGRTLGAKKLCQAWENLSQEEKEELSRKKSCPDPVMSTFLPHSHPDVISEKFRHLLNVYCKKGFSKVVSQMSQKLNPESFKNAINKKVVQSLAQPGEAVGLVCAQSIGEPSTQMTLNTFHFAGRGEMNVTLGIPRLREILMTASAHIKTPSMDVPVRQIPNARAKAERLQRHLNRITLDRVMQSVKVKVKSRSSNPGPQIGNYKVIEAKFKFLPHEDYSEFTNLTPKAILTFMAQKFLAMFDNQIKKENIVLEKATLLSSGRLRRSPGAEKEGDESKASPDARDDRNNAEEDVEIEPNDGDASAVREQQRQLDTQEYEGEEEEKREVGQDDEDDLGENGNFDGTVEENKEDEPGNEDDANSSDEEISRIEELSKEDKDLITHAKSYSFVEDFTFDQKKKRWCTATFVYEQSHLQLDMKMLLERTIKHSVLHHIRGINRAFLSEETEEGEKVMHLKTEGVNIQEMFQYPDILDLNRLYSNCIHTMASTYGIEAANRVIVKEIQNVFGAYGITVDYRHLSLLADYMTTRGEYDAFNRRDIVYNPSAFQKMTFETTMKFLLDACLSGTTDKLTSPSSRLVVGKVVGVGTGSFDILDPL